MKRFLIVLMLLLATCSVALSRTSTKRKTARSMAGISVVGNVLRYNSAWKVGTKNDITYLFKKKKVTQVLMVTCKCEADGSCYLAQFPDGLKCMPRDCTGTCKIGLKWVTTTDPIDFETP